MAVNMIKSFNTISPAALGISKNQNTEQNITGFSDYLKNALEKVNDLQIQSEKISEDFALGKNDNIHQVIIAAEKADIALQLAMQIRNKIMDAYNEIMRMQI